MLPSSARLRLLLHPLLRRSSSTLSPPSFSTTSVPFTSSHEDEADGDDDSSIPLLSTTTAASAASPAPTQESVLYVLKKLDKMPQKALAFFRCLTSQHAFSPGPAAHNLMLRILGAAPHRDHLADFWSFLRSMRAAGHALDQGTYVTLVAHFKKHKMAAEAATLAQFHSGAVQTAAADETVRLVAKALLDSAAGWSEDLEENLKNMKLQMSEIMVAKVVREVRDHPLKALGFFWWAGRRPEYKHGSIAYNGMVRALAHESSMVEFWSLIQEMKAEGHEMDIDTYIKVTRHFLKCRMLKEAVELYKLMMDGPYKPAIQDCGMLLRQIALSGTPDLDLVYGVVQKYEAAGYSLSKVVYDGIHRCLTSIGKFDDAEEIMKKMKLEGHEPDNITYSQLVYGLCKANRFDEAYKVLDDMEAGGCTPDLKTWTVLIQGHCTAGEVDKALELLTKMIERDYEADADVLDILVKGLCSKDRAAGAYTFIVEMVENAKLRPWQATYKYLIQELLKAKMLEDALKVLSLMKTHKFPPFPDPFPPFIAKHGTTEDAREFLKALTVNQYPSPTAYLKVFESFFKEVRYSEAQDLLFRCPYHIRKHADICKLFDSMKPESAS